MRSAAACGRLGLTLMNMLLLLLFAGCGVLQAGVESPAIGSTRVAPVSTAGDTIPSQTPPAKPTSMPTPSLGPTVERPAGEYVVTAWLGHVSSVPAETGFDDCVVLQPEGAGQVGVTGATAELESQIKLLRDAEGVGEYANFWGTLTCGVEDYGGCRLLVTHLRYGSMLSEPEPVEDWRGTIVSNLPGAQFDDYFILEGAFRVGYGITSLDELLRGQLSSLRDTSVAVRVWGGLRAGVPDAFGTQIEVNRIELAGEGPASVPTPPDQADPYGDWASYANTGYGFSFRYPPTWVLRDGPNVVELDLGGAVFRFGYRWATEDVDILPEGVRGLEGSGTLTLLGSELQRGLLVAGGKVKGVIYGQILPSGELAEVQAGDLSFVASVLGEGDPEAIALSKGAMSEADRVIGSFAFVPQ